MHLEELHEGHPLLQQTRVRRLGEGGAPDGHAPAAEDAREAVCLGNRREEAVTAAGNEAHPATDASNGGDDGSVVGPAGGDKLADQPGAVEGGAQRRLLHVEPPGGLPRGAPAVGGRRPVAAAPRQAGAVGEEAPHDRRGGGVKEAAADKVRLQQRQQW